MNKKLENDYKSGKITLEEYKTKIKEIENIKIETINEENVGAFKKFWKRSWWSKTLTIVGVLVIIGIPISIIQASKTITVETKLDIPAVEYQPAITSHREEFSLSDSDSMITITEENAGKYMVTESEEDPWTCMTNVNGTDKVSSSIIFQDGDKVKVHNCIGGELIFTPVGEEKIITPEVPAQEAYTIIYTMTQDYQGNKTCTENGESINCEKIPEEQLNDLNSKILESSK